MKLAVSVALVALLVGAPWVLSSPLRLAIQTSAELSGFRHFQGVCEECPWTGDVYDRRGPAQQECLEHAREKGHCAC